MESVLDIIPKQQNLESVTKEISERGKIRSRHPAVFPMYLPSEYIVAFTNDRDWVLEPFGGSGTTLMACEQLNRNCAVMEYSHEYADVIIDRWEKFTGDEAVRIE